MGNAVGSGVGCAKAKAEGVVDMEVVLVATGSVEDARWEPGDVCNVIQKWAGHLIKTFEDVCRAACEGDVVGAILFQVYGGGVPGIFGPNVFDACVHAR